jgi:hypothetical protein
LWAKRGAFWRQKTLFAPKTFNLNPEKRAVELLFLPPNERFQSLSADSPSDPPRRLAASKAARRLRRVGSVPEELDIGPRDLGFDAIWHDTRYFFKREEFLHFLIS